MMKTLLLGAALALSATLFAQVASQDFDAATTWGVTLDPADGTFTAATDVWGIRDPASFTFVAVGSGSFLAGRDINNNDNPNGGFALATFGDQVVDPSVDHTITFDYDIVGFDGTDRLQYEVVLDGVASGLVTVFAGSSTVKDASGTETIAIPAGPSTIGLIIRVTQDGGSDYIGLDNFVLTAAVPMPVTLTSFTGRPAAQGVELAWEVASQRDNDFFAVEMSRDGTDFAEVGRVDGAGTTNATENYRYLHATDAAGDHYFRLRQVDLDGTATYSPLVLVQLSPDAGATGTLRVQATGARGYVQVTRGADARGDVLIADMTGKVVARHALADASATISVAELPAGVYLVTDGATTRRFVVE